MRDDPGATLRALRRPGDPFVLMNAWDAGSARMLAALGADAIGTTSAGFAFTLGLPDGARISRDQALAHLADLVAATSLPVSADLENGYGGGSRSTSPKPSALPPRPGSPAPPSRTPTCPAPAPTGLASPLSAFRLQPPPRGRCRGISSSWPAPTA